MANYNRDTARSNASINAELEKIQNSIADKLDRNPSTGQPNNMNTNLDMNNNRVYNLESPVDNKDAVTKEYVDQIAINACAQGVIPVEAGRQTGDGVTALYADVPKPSDGSTPDTRSYQVYLDGVKQKPFTDYSVSAAGMLFVKAPADGVSIDITFYEPAVSSEFTKANLHLYTDHVFKTVADMKASLTIGGDSVVLNVGDSVRTQGYYSVGDGGHAEYVVVAAATGTDDGGSYHDLDNGLQAQLVIKNATVNAKQYGIFDSLADNLTQFKKFVNNTNINIAEITGGVHIISDSLDVVRSHIHIKLIGDAAIKTEVATTFGHTISFLGVIDPDGDIDDPNNLQQLENCHISGGRIFNSSPSNTENAIGFERVRNFSARNIRIPNATRKAITAQSNNKDTGGGVYTTYVNSNFVIENIEIGTTDFRGISIEGDVTGQGVIRNISAGTINNDNFIHYNGSNTPNERADKIIVENVKVGTVGGHAVYGFKATEMFVKGVSALTVGKRGINLIECGGGSVDDLFFDSVGQEGVRITDCSDSFVVSKGNIKNTSVTTPSTYNGLYFDNNDKTIYVTNLISRGTQNQYAVFKGQSTDDVQILNSSFAAGTDTTYSAEGLHGLRQPLFIFSGLINSASKTTSPLDIEVYKSNDQFSIERTGSSTGNMGMHVNTDTVVMHEKGNTANWFMKIYTALKAASGGRNKYDLEIRSSGGANSFSDGRVILSGGYYLWVDSSGRLRIKGGEPTSDTDGTIVGTQS